MSPSRRKKKSPGKAGEFSAAFFALSSVEDLAGWSPADLSAVAASMYDLARVRERGAFKVRVWPLPGAGTAPSVVGIVGDDTPHVVDSVSAELVHRGLNVEALFHPILNVARDAQGAIRSVRPVMAGESAPGAETCVFLRLERALKADEAAALETWLLRVLSDVSRAASDKKPMLDRVGDAVSSLSAAKEGEAEGRALLSYMHGGDFTFLGCREYRFVKGKAEPAGTGLGVLRGVADPAVPEGFAEALSRARGPVVVGKLADHYSTVSRRAPMDAVAVRITGARGKITGMRLFVGLFSSLTYSRRAADIPVVRGKVSEVMRRAGFASGSHDARALEGVLEKMPRDELFQTTTEDILSLALGILRLQDKPRTALFTHLDPLRKYMSCLLYVPRDRYNTAFRVQAGKILAGALQGRLMNFFVTLDDGALARVLFMIRLPAGHAGDFDSAAAAARLVELGREWDEGLRDVLVAAHGRQKGLELAGVYGHAFTAAYQQAMALPSVQQDIRQIETLERSKEALRVDLYRAGLAAGGVARLKVYSRGAPVVLSAIMPVIENMGFSAASEMPYEVRPLGRDSAWIHDFVLAGALGIDLSVIKRDFEETFLKVWEGRVENDGFNRLVVAAGLTWREARLFRALAAFLRQARFPYSGSYVAQVLSEHPGITRALVSLFMALHDPKGKGRDAGGHGAKIDALLQDVDKLDHDRILRLFRLLIEKTLRTNYFQEDKECISFKFDSRNIDGLPLPRPHVEIFVYSPRLEAVHLRSGRIARGGLRWSDRPDDFRTEVLGLMKAQTVKNTVIVPTGAKGGFVLKRPPKDRAALQEEGVACYKIFIRSLLELTDNDVKGRIVRPRDVFCHDGPDPYLVVAADKGTAKFSDIANALSQEAGFWLGDAFASGGSAGYDHKGIGITARGGWEAVLCHFRELGKDIQAEPFTVAGVGDMGGDVFGNAMLLSRQIRLVGAFNHLHIFCDPDPDPASSFAERARLFKGGLGWDAYDRKKLSAGGAVFERSAKSLKLSSQIRKRFGLSQETATPDELIRALLKAEVELFWFGGIGTTVKASKESHADAGDKASDSCRVDATELRAKVVGEGANLALTQLGRVEFARCGGRLNTDFIDNSAGVDCSDHEVNIKILLGAVSSKGGMSLKARNVLLERMTDDVAALVLSDNYQQNLSLSLQQRTAKDLVGVHASLTRSLEKSGLIRRALEGLPDDEALARLAREGQGLTRPELCVLTSWAKIALYNEVIASDIPDDPSLEGMLFDYFPKALHRYKAEIRAHRLRREIIATQVVNILVNRMGAAFVFSRMEKTGCSATCVARAFLIVMETFGLRALWAAVEALDGTVPGGVQAAALEEIYQLARRAVTWMLRFGGMERGISAVIAAFRPGIAALRKNLPPFLPEQTARRLRDADATLAAQGLPPPLAADLAALRLLASACDIVSLSPRMKGGIGKAAAAYFQTDERLSIGWLKAEAFLLRPANNWQSRVISSLLDDYYAHQAVLAAEVMRSPRWFEKHADAVQRFDRMIAEMKAQPKPELDMFVLAGQRLGHLAAGSGG